MRALMLTAVLISGVSSAAADDVRYRLERAGEAFVRMDTQTGAMSLCEPVGAGLRCTPAAEQGGEGGLDARLAALEARIAALEGREPAGAALPTDEEFERTLGFMERFMRRFIGIARELGDEKAPDRT